LDYLIEIVGREFAELAEIKKILREIKGEKYFLTDDLEVYRSRPKRRISFVYLLLFYFSTCGQPLSLIGSVRK
jgi:hypothetical protein